MSGQLDSLTKQVDRIENTVDKLDVTHVLQKEFEPIKKLIYGAVALILIGVLGAALASIGLS